MIDFCIRTDTAEFKQACEDNLLSPASLESCLAQYYSENGEEFYDSFPSYEYISNWKIQGNYKTSELGINLYEMKYKDAVSYTDKALVQSYIDSATAAFGNNCIRYYEDNKGNKYVQVLKPTNNNGEFSKTDDNIYYQKSKTPWNKEGTYQYAINALKKTANFRSKDGDVLSFNTTNSTTIYSVKKIIDSIEKNTGHKFDYALTSFSLTLKTDDFSIEEKYKGDNIQEAIKSDEKIPQEYKEILEELYSTDNIDRFEELELEILNSPYIKKVWLLIKNRNLKTKGNSLLASYNRNYLKRVNSDLSTKLFDILKQFNVDVQKVDMQKVFGANALGAYDFISKIIYLEADELKRNSVTDVEEFSHAFLKLMGSGAYKSLSFQDDWYKYLENTSLYKEVYDTYKNIYKDSNGNVDESKIKEEALGLALATVILDRYNNENNSFFENLKLWFINAFNSLKVAILKNVDNEYLLKRKLNTLADSILNGSYDKYLNADNYNNTLVTFEDTILLNEEDIESKHLIETLTTKYGALVDGSLALRALGTVYRNNVGDLHDIDFSIPYESHNIAPEDLNESNVLKSSVIKALEKEFPELSLKYVFSTPYTGVTVTYKYKKHDGTTSTIDLFFNRDDSNLYPITTQRGIRMANFANALSAKDKMGRIKDNLDIRNFKTFKGVTNNNRKNVLLLLSKNKDSFVELPTKDVESIDKKAESMDLVFLEYSEARTYPQKLKIARDKLGISENDILDIQQSDIYAYALSMLRPGSLKRGNDIHSKGIKSELGVNSSDLKGMNSLFNETKGITIDLYVHSLYEDRPVQSWEDTDIKDALLGVLSEVETYQDVRSYTLDMLVLYKLEEYDYYRSLEELEYENLTETDGSQYSEEDDLQKNEGRESQIQLLILQQTRFQQSLQSLLSDRAKEVGLKASEVKLYANKVAYEISDLLTDFSKKPNVLREKFPELYDSNKESASEFNKRIKSMSRQELFDFIGCSNLLKYVQNNIFEENSLIPDEDVDKASLLSENIESLFVLAQDTFSTIEGFHTNLGDKLSKIVEDNVENLVSDSPINENTLDRVDITGNKAEEWAIESRTKDVLGTASAEVKLLLSQLYDLDEHNKPKTDSWGIKERIDPNEATKKILKFTRDTWTLKDMIAALKTHTNTDPWLSQIISKLSNTSGEYSSLLSLFFSTMCKPFLNYVISTMKGGKLINKYINKSPVLDMVMKEIKANYKLGNNIIFKNTGDISEKAAEAFRRHFELINSLTRGGNLFSVLGPNVKNLIVESFTKLAYGLGYSCTNDEMAKVLEENNNFKVMFESVKYINSGILSIVVSKTKVDPFEFKRGVSSSMLGNYTNFLAPLVAEAEDVIKTSFYDNGKMYLSNVTPSYLTKLKGKFHRDTKQFELFLKEEYQTPFLYNKTKNKYRNGWLLLMSKMDTKTRREIFNHVVLLSSNKKNYMKDMNSVEYGVAVVLQYFASLKKIANYDVALYRTTMMSNKPSAEFILFVAYRGDFSSSKVSDGKVTGTVSIAKLNIVNGLVNTALLELDRIRTCKLRQQIGINKKDPRFIKSFDVNGHRFLFMSYMNEYLTGSKKDSKLGKALNNYVNNGEVLNIESTTALNNAIIEELDKITDTTIKNWTDSGFANVIQSTVDGINSANIESNLREFVWNDHYATIQIQQLTITDLAFYKDTEDLQKRYALIHAPGIRPNIHAVDFTGKPISDGKFRTLILKDFDGIKTNIKENLEVVFDEKIQKSKSKLEKEGYEVLKESILDAFDNINVADALGFSSPTSYRKKALMFGKWDEASEELYLKIKSSNYNYSDLSKAWLPFKPFVYSLIIETSHVDLAPLGELKIPTLYKNSEYLLIMADAILQGLDTGKPNLLRALYTAMENSYSLDNTKGIDTVLFESTTKSGLTGILDLNLFTEDADGELKALKYIEDNIYTTLTSKDAIGNEITTKDYNNIFVRTNDAEDYSMLLEVPEHYKGHSQQHGSLIRALTITDLLDGVYTFQDGNKTLNLNAEEFKAEFEKVVSENINEDVQALRKELSIDTEDKVAINTAISKILQEEILSNARKGLDLYNACSVDENGNFKIPLGDPIQAKQIELFINSIIKSRVNKQKIAGGPIVLVTNFGTSRRLNIRFKDSEGNLLLTKELFESSPLKSQYDSFQSYVKNNQDSIAYYEVFAPIPDDEIVAKFAKKDGSIDIQKIEKEAPDLLKLVGYRIPTEDKYSMFPAKIVGFLPREAGEGIILPYEITTITGSDFDVDKMYIMRKELNLVTDEFKLKKSIFDDILLDYKKTHNNNKMPSNMKAKILETINYLVQDPEGRKDISPLYENVYKIYLKVESKCKKYILPKNNSRKARNNKIVEMTYAVLTNKTQTDKVLNPGGFESLKQMGYLVQAYRVSLGKYKYEDLEKLASGKYYLHSDGTINNSKSKDSITGTEALKKLSYKTSDLTFFSDLIQFYKLNNAAGAILGMFAVLRSAHAFLENNKFYLDVDGVLGAGRNSYVLNICGKDYKGLMEIDPTFDSNNNYVGKVLGSLVASAADAVKDPVLNLMNINSNTANVLTTMIRLGATFEDASLLLSTDVIGKCLLEFLVKSSTQTTSFKLVLDSKIEDLESKLSIGPDSNIAKEPLTKQELTLALDTNKESATKDKIDYKILIAYKNLNALANELRGLTFATRFNSISAAVGPLVVDNILSSNKINSFSEHIQAYDLSGTLLTITFNDVLDKHPILKGFHEAYNIADKVFKSTPSGSANFSNVMHSFEDYYLQALLDRVLLSKLSDFYSSYIFNSAGTQEKLIDMFNLNIPGYKEIKNSEKYQNEKREDIEKLLLKYFIQDFPKEFSNFKSNNKDNLLINNIRLDIRDSSNLIFLQLDTSGTDSNYISRLLYAWDDLHYSNPEMSVKLFLYNYYKGGLAFSPKTFMSIVPTEVKIKITPYIEAFSDIDNLHLSPELIMDLFVKNNLDNNQLVPIKKVQIATSSTGTLYATGKNTSSIEDTIYFKIGNKLDGFKYYKVIKDNIVEEVTPLGDNGNYLEIYSSAASPIEMSKKPTTEWVDREQSDISDILNNPIDDVEYQYEENSNQIWREDDYEWYLLEMFKDSKITIDLSTANASLMLARASANRMLTELKIKQTIQNRAKSFFELNNIPFEEKDLTLLAEEYLKKCR